MSALKLSGKMRVIALDKSGASIAPCAQCAELLALLEDAEFLMRQAGKIAGPMQDSFNRVAEDARAAMAKAKP